MAVCSKCKQNASFTVKDAQQICGRCGATTTIAKLQTENFKGIKIQKHYISEKREKKVILDKSSIKHIEENWGIYLEAFQRALRESIRTVKIKLNLDDSFEEKAKYYWFEYLKVYGDNNIPLLAFFTTARQGNNLGKEEKNEDDTNTMKKQAVDSETNNQAHGIKKKLYESKYKQKKSVLAKVEQSDIGEEYLEEDSQDQYDQNFVEKILKQKSTQEQQKQVLMENDDIFEIFRQFEDTSRVNFEQSQFQEIDSIGNPQKTNNSQSNIFNDPILELLGKQKKDQANSLDGNYKSQNYTATAKFSANGQNQKLKQQQQMKQELQGVMNTEMHQYQLLQQQQQQLEQKKKKKRRMKGKINYIENMEECSKNYFTLVLERSESYVKTLYNGFRSAYMHMIYLQEKEYNPLKRIKKLKDSSKGFSISKSFILKQIEKRRILFLKKYDKIDIFHLIWAWDWAEFISSQSSIQFTLKDDVQLLYDYLDRIYQIICKQLKEHQNIDTELNKGKQQLMRTKKLNEIKKKLINKSKEIKEKNNKGYLSGEDEDEEQGGIYEVINKFKYESTPRIPKLKISSTVDLVLDPLDLNQPNSATIQNANNSIIPDGINDPSQQQQAPRKSSAAQLKINKSDEHVDQEKVIEELEFQFERFQSKKVVNLDEEQLLTLQVIVEEILKERDLICGEKHKAQNPLFGDFENENGVENKKQDKLLPLEYHIIPTIIYVALYSIGETYTPIDVNFWMKSGLFPYNLGIGPYIKIADARIYWMYPQSIPSCTYIRSIAKKFIQMTNHTIKVSKKRVFMQSLRIISDFGLPLEWACMIYVICVRLYKDKFDKELAASDEFDCDIIVSAALIVLLKMIYGLNDEMFGVLLNNDILEEAKDYLSEKQYSFLQAIVQHFEHTRFRRTTQFYNSIPTFKQVANSIQNFISQQKSEQVLDLTDYKQMTNLSYSNLLILFQSFLDKHKLQKVHTKIQKNSAITQNQQSQLSSQLMQGNKSAIKSQRLTQQAAQLQYDDFEDEILFIKQMKSHLPKTAQNSMNAQSPNLNVEAQVIEPFFFTSIFGGQSQNSQVDQQSQSNKDGISSSEGTFSVNKQFNFTQRKVKEQKKFSDCFEQDLQYITNKVITQGKSLAPPCYDYEIEKSYETNSKTLPNELKFVVDKLSIYTGENTAKILHYLERIEGKIYNLVIKNTKSNISANGVFLQMLSQNIAKKN